MNTYVKKEKERSKLRMAGGAWTINLDIVDIFRYDFIEYITEKKKYRISRQEALDKGFIKYFMNEKKLIVPIKFWNAA